MTIRLSDKVVIMHRICFTNVKQRERVGVFFEAEQKITIKSDLAVNKLIYEKCTINEPKAHP